MKRHIYLAALGIFASVQVGLAQDPCFCLRDAYDNWLRDCRAVKVGIAPQPKTVCYDPLKQYRVAIPALQGWNRVDEGQTGCPPCIYQRSTGPDPIRGDEQTKQDIPPKEKPDATQ